MAMPSSLQLVDMHICWQSAGGRLAAHQSVSRPWSSSLLPSSCPRTRRQRRCAPCQGPLAAAAAAAAAAVTPPAVAPAPATAPATRAPGTREQYEATRTLYIGGLPWRADMDVVVAALAPLCRGATHIEVAALPTAPSRTVYPPGSKHRGFALVAFRAGIDAEAAAVAVAAASAAGLKITGVPADLRTGPAIAVPPSWQPQLTRTDAELQLAAEQATAAAQHTAHLRRRRQRVKVHHADSIAALLERLPPPGGHGVAGAYSPLLQGLAMQLAGSSDEEAQRRLAAIVSSWQQWSPRLAAAVRLDVLLRHVRASFTAPPAFAAPIRLAPDTPPAKVEGELVLDWSQLPAICDPAAGGGLGSPAGSLPAGATPALNSRALRKRVQVESFALALLQLLNPQQQGQQAQLEVVDFGSTTGNLVLPLAVLFPSYSFTAVDMKAAALRLLQARVQSLGLSNVRVHQVRIEDYAGRMDVVLALHACGAASDHSLMTAVRQRAAFVVSPCCIGKVNVTDDGSSGVNGKSDVLRPRSRWMAEALHASQQAPHSTAAAYATLASAADFSHHDGHSYADLAVLAKANLELDRCKAAEVGAYHNALTRLLQPQLTAKSDVLLGVPVERCRSGGTFLWRW